MQILWKHTVGCYQQRLSPEFMAAKLHFQLLRVNISSGICHLKLIDLGEGRVMIDRKKVLALVKQEQIGANFLPRL